MHASVALAGVGAVIASVAVNMDAAATSCKVLFAIDLISLVSFLAGHAGTASADDLEDS
jgi:hypothetical protein